MRTLLFQKKFFNNNFSALFLALLFCGSGSLVFLINCSAQATVGNALSGPASVKTVEDKANPPNDAQRDSPKTIEQYGFGTVEDNYCELGWRYLKQGNMLEAQKLFTKAVSYNPHSWRGYAGLSEVYLWKRQYKLSEEYAFKVLENNPDGMVMVYTSVGRIRAFAGDLAGAKEILNRAIDVSAPQEDQAPRALLGQIYLKEGNIEAAEKELKKCKSRNIQHPEIQELDLLISQYKRKSNKTIPNP